MVVVVVGVLSLVVFTFVLRLLCVYCVLFVLPVCLFVVLLCIVVVCVVVASVSFSFL